MPPSLLHYATIFTSLCDHLYIHYTTCLHHNYSKLILFILRMLWSRNIYRFCVAQTYLQRFAELEKEVNCKEQEYLATANQIQRIRELSKQSAADHLNKVACLLLNKKYAPTQVINENQALSQLREKLMTLQQEEAKRCQIAKKFNNEEKQRRQKLFLVDLARFSNQFQQVSAKYVFSHLIKEGLTLSQKNIEKTLEKEGVVFLGEEREDFNNVWHVGVVGSGFKVGQVIERGIKIGQCVMQKAKVRLI